MRKNREIKMKGILPIIFPLRKSKSHLDKIYNYFLVGESSYRFEIRALFMMLKNINKTENIKININNIRMHNIRY